MKHSYFKNVLMWATRKMREEGVTFAWYDLLKNFREESKNYSRLVCPFKNSYTGQVLYNHYAEKYSWSFEKFGFKPSNQKDADILVFRYKCFGKNIRVVHKIQKS